MDKELSKRSEELILHYRPPALAYGGIVSRLMIALLLSIVIPTSLYTIVIVVQLLIACFTGGPEGTLLFQNPERIQRLFNGIFWMIITAGTPLLVVLTMVLANTRLLISKQAISFPLMFFPWLGLHRKLRWSEIKEIVLIKASNNNQICVQLDSSHTLPLQLNYFSQADSQKLVGSIDYLGVNCIVPSRFACQSTDLSFTQIWEEEVARKIGNTTFLTLEAGTMLQGENIRIIKQLSGHGRTASYLGRWLEKKLIVLKEVAIPRAKADMPARKIYDQFERECSFLLRLDHPKISRVLDNFVENERNYLLLEFIPGTDLRQYVRKNGALPEKEVLDLVLQLTNIVEYLHSFEPPIIHRDITPDNIVLGDDGSIYLIDFGIANELVVNVTGTMVGKQAYMAPEQVRGKASTQSDIYSLGATMYFLSTGQEPPALTKLTARTVSHSISEQLDQVISNCTEPEVADRCQSVSELVEKITKLINHNRSNASKLES
jgi:serine/threonine protein kinase